ncbi:hypothetical protein cypCar_00039959 [Cyprinus carpio]|nr:hypothetical protein cypCar_00039959 [Cyprinus carpio]
MIETQAEREHAQEKVEEELQGKAPQPGVTERSRRAVEMDRLDKLSTIRWFSEEKGRAVADLSDRTHRERQDVMKDESRRHVFNRKRESAQRDDYSSWRGTILRRKTTSGRENIDGVQSVRKSCVLLERERRFESARSEAHQRLKEAQISF